MAAKVVANIMPYLVTIGLTYGMTVVNWTLFAWFLEAVGVLEFPWLWAIIDPNAGTDNTLADQWVELNTSWVGIAIDTVAKSQGQDVADFDLKDGKNMQNVKFVSYPLLHSNMMPSLLIGQVTGPLTILLTTLFAGDIYKDEAGNAKEGWPEIIARTVQF